MGGAKKKPISQAEKSQQTIQGEKPSKKAKEAKPAQASRAANPLVPHFTDEQIAQTLGPLKAITTYAAARALGIKASIASSFLKSLESKGFLKKTAGYSGHYVYSLSATAETRGAGQTGQTRA